MHFQDELPQAFGAPDKRVDWAAVKAELIANEGQWGLMAENMANTTPSQLRRGNYAAFRGDELAHFEFASRRPENPDAAYGTRRADIWGRYTRVLPGKIGD